MLSPTDIAVLKSLVPDMPAAQAKDLLARVLSELLSALAEAKALRSERDYGPMP